jgi:hypothetical protein
MLRVSFLITLLSAGCGPIEYVTTVTFQATKAVSQARRAGADKTAIYDYTLAAEYLHKSKELAGHARWQESVRFGKRALDHGRRAELAAHEKAARPDEKPQ